MNAIKKAKISAKLYKQLDKNGLLKEVKVFRCGKNAFGENVENLYVCTVKVYYYQNKLKISLQSAEAASLNTGYEDKLLVMNDDESEKIQKDDCFTLDGVRYKILELGNVENIVFDMSLERM